MFDLLVCVNLYKKTEFDFKQYKIIKIEFIVENLAQSDFDFLQDFCNFNYISSITVTLAWVG